MPRTRAVKKKKAEPPMSEWSENSLKVITEAKQLMLATLEKSENELMAYLDRGLKQSMMTIPAHLLNKKMRDLAELPLDWSGSTSSVSIMQVMNATKTLTEKKKKPLARSSSLNEDEGYLTAESSRGTSGRRSSRSRTQIKAKNRPSRSASTSKTNHARYKTPAGRAPPTSYGTVTPKMKPNTPQVVLRRPKQGEVALSMQGSPLFTGNVVSDDIANVNIPLRDGRLLTIQPKSGMRLSQIPTLDKETAHQLKTLSENLLKMCAAVDRAK